MDGTSDKDGAFENVGSDDGANDASVGPVVEDGIPEGTGVGAGDSDGLLLG